MVLLDNGCQVNTVSPEFGRLTLSKLDWWVIWLKVGCAWLTQQDAQSSYGLHHYKGSSRWSRGLWQRPNSPHHKDLSTFASRVPVTLGTPMIRKVNNVIKESKLDVLATPWVNAWVTYLLAVHWANMKCIGGKVTKQPMNPTDLNEVVKTRRVRRSKGSHLKSSLLGWWQCSWDGNLHVMTHALGKGNKPLPYGLAVQDMYTEMTTGSKRVVVVVRNMTATPIMLKKNTPVARVVANNAVPNAQVLLGMVKQLDAAQGNQMGRPKMTVEQQKDGLFEQLDLSSLNSWTPKSRAVACSLLAEYHDIFSLDSCMLGCMDLEWHVIKVRDDELFKEMFRWIPPPADRRSMGTCEGDAGNRYNMALARTWLCWSERRMEFGLLHWLPLTQCTHEEGFISTPMYPRGDREPGWSGTLLLSGSKIRFLASWDGWRVEAVYSLHHRESQILQMWANAIWALKHSSNLPIVNVELFRRIESDILPDLSWWHGHFLKDGGRAFAWSMSCVWLILWV